MTLTLAVNIMDVWNSKENVYRFPDWPDCDTDSMPFGTD